MTKGHRARLMGCLLAAYVLFILAGTLPAAAFTSMSDDFSGDSGNWQYVGSAKRTNGYIEVAPASSGTVGIAALKQDVRYPFVVEFRAQTSSSGEGLVFMFHHAKNYTPAGGSALGFQPASGSNSGWGVELDTRSSSGYSEPGAHVGLISDSASTHLKTDTSINFNNGGWHSYKVEIQWSTIVLTFDGKEVWHFSDYSYKNKQESGMGFGAASSGGSFKIDDFKLQNPGEAEMWYWVTFGLIVGTIFFGTLGGIVVWGSLRWRAVFKQYAQPGANYSAYTLDNNMRKQILSAAAQSPDPDVRRLRHGFRMAHVGQGVASFLMLAVLIGTMFMPPMVLLTVGIVLYVVFISLFAVAAVLAGRRSKPFVILMGQRMGYLPPATSAAPGPYGYQAPPFPMQAQPQPTYPPPQQAPLKAPPPAFPSPQQPPYQSQAPPSTFPSPQQAPYRSQAPPSVQAPEAAVEWGEPPAISPTHQPPPASPPPSAYQQPPSYQPPSTYQPPPYQGVGTQPYRPAKPPQKQ